ncbi:MAG: hypothetical protein IJV65_02755 [Kiritimatiellae bacterium]|nr:hypothetical protein [Kiritimatiellia bacterium]
MKRNTSGFARGARAALALAGAAWAASCPASLVATDLPRERYDVISEKAPFGPPPPTQEELDRLKQLEDAKNESPPDPVPEPPADIIPEGLDKIKIVLLSRYRGVPAVGFLDGSDNRSYYLLEGQKFEDIACTEVDLENRTATLERNGRSAELPLWINPATTNQADVTSYGQPGGHPVDPSAIRTKTDWEVAQDRERARTDARERMEEARRRREERRAEREERRRQAEEEMAALTPEERERRLHEINLDLIINDKGPPLPIDLDAEDRARLREAGFDLPDESEFDDEAARRPRGRRGRRGPPPTAGPEAPPAPAGPEAQ